MCLFMHISVCMCSACTSYWSIRDTAVGMATRLWRRRSQVRIPARERYFSLLQNVHTGCPVVRLSYSVVPGLFPWCRSVMLTTHLPLVSRLRMSGVLFYSPSFAFVACTGITWPSLDIYVHLYAWAYWCVSQCVCVCVYMKEMLSKLWICWFVFGRYLFRILARTPSS
jgi:hypothetical protein